MASLNISMPEEMRRFIDERVSQAGYSTPTEYVRSLVREDQKRARQEVLESLLLEGLESGLAKVLTEDDWSSIRQAVKDRLKARVDRG